MTIKDVRPGQMFGWKSDGVIDKVMLDQDSPRVRCLAYHTSYNDSRYYVHIPTGRIEYMDVTGQRLYGYNQEKYEVIVKE